MKDYKISDDLLQEVSAGTSILPENWQEIALSMVSQYKSLYKGITYTEACAKVCQIITDPDDQAKVLEFLLQFFDEAGNLID